MAIPRCQKRSLRLMVMNFSRMRKECTVEIKGNLYGKSYPNIQNQGGAEIDQQPVTDFETNLAIISTRFGVKWHQAVIIPSRYVK